MSEPGILNKFYSIFKGNPTFYVKHQYPLTEDLETGKVSGRWVGIAVDKNKDKLPVTIEKFREHLNGEDGIAIEPLTPKNTCFFSCIDIDVHGITYTTLIQRLYKYGLKFAAFVSKSKGLHIYFFFQDEEKGDAVIAAMKRVVEVFGLNKLYTNDKGKSRVEIFPKHPVIKPGDQGSCIFLPYYNAAGNWHQKLVTSEGKLLSIINAITYIEGGMFTSVEEINRTVDALPWSDAPFCVQMIALTGALGEGDGRNDYIYQTGVYLKKKQQDNFLDEMKKINAELAEPQPDKDVESTYASIMTPGKTYEYKCKTGPCAEYCDTKLCKLREYGVGKDRGNVSTGFACWGEISRVMAEEPYYIWKVQIDEGGPFIDIRIDGEADLMNEMVVARACVRYANRAPKIVQTNQWINTVNGSLQGIENRIIEIPKSTDTTEMSALRGYFIRFLTHKQIQNGQPYLIQLHQVYNEQNIYYFTTEGFKEYLRIQKFAVGRLNLREELIRFGCRPGEVKYKTKSGEKSIQCWQKETDETINDMTTFFDDVAEADEAIIEGNKLNKVDDGIETHIPVKVEEQDGGTNGGYKF